MGHWHYYLQYHLFNLDFSFSFVPYTWNSVLNSFRFLFYCLLVTRPVILYLSCTCSTSPSLALAIAVTGGRVKTTAPHWHSPKRTLPFPLRLSCRGMLRPVRLPQLREPMKPPAVGVGFCVGEKIVSHAHTHRSMWVLEPMSITSPDQTAPALQAPEAYCRDGISTDLKRLRTVQLRHTSCPRTIGIIALSYCLLLIHSSTTIIDTADP